MELMFRVTLENDTPLSPIILSLSTGPQSGAEEEVAISALAGVIFGLKKDLVKEHLAEEDFPTEGAKQVIVGSDLSGPGNNDDSIRGGGQSTPAHPIQRLTLGVPRQDGTAATST